MAARTSGFLLLWPSASQLSVRLCGEALGWRRDLCCGSFLRNSVNPTLVEAEHFGIGTRGERDGDVAFNWRYIRIKLIEVAALSGSMSAERQLTPVIPLEVPLLQKKLIGAGVRLERF